MKNMSLNEITQACGGVYHGDPASALQKVENVATDSRKVEKNGLFIALKGARVDGHSFIPQVMENGALCAVSEEDLGDVSFPWIKVSSCLQALKDIASVIARMAAVIFLLVTNIILSPELLNHGIQFTLMIAPK